MDEHARKLWLKIYLEVSKSAKLESMMIHQVTVLTVGGMLQMIKKKIKLKLMKEERIIQFF